jgi:uracil-DNA glycosylase
MIKKLEKLNDKCKNCASCELHDTRNNIVFSDGNPETASLVLIGEAPGENEDKLGKPFVGDAGHNLDKFLKDAGISRNDDLYIINTVKCRPPKNRKPKKAEKEACRDFLYEQIDIINPKIIILCGSTAMNEFLKGKKITDIHGTVFDIDVLDKTYKAIPILHPSPLCTYPDKKNVMIKDLLLAKSLT